MEISLRLICIKMSRLPLVARHDSARSPLVARHDSARRLFSHLLFCGTMLAAAFEFLYETVDTSDFAWDVDLLRAFDSADAASDTSVGLSQAWNCSVVADQVCSSVFCVLIILLVIIDEAFIYTLVIVSKD